MGVSSAPKVKFSGYQPQFRRSDTEEVGLMRALQCTYIFSRTQRMRDKGYYHNYHLSCKVELYMM